MIVKNSEPLDFSYTPSKLPFREKELADIRKILIEPIKSGIYTNLVIYGDSGTGKTVSLKFLIREEKDPLMIYENALSFGNLKILLLDVINRLGGITANRSLPYKDIFRIIKKSLEARKTGLVLVIDEAVNILRNDNDGFYNLLRARELYSVPVSTVMISIDNPLMYMTRDDRRSVGIFSSLRFQRYTQDELYGIIEERARLALVDTSYTPDILYFISDIAQQFGSGRVAIELLQKSAYISEYRKSEMLENEDVRAAKALINPYITESKLAELDNDELVVLLSICRCLMNETETQISSIILQADSFCEQYEMRKMDSSKIYRIVKKLETIGLIDGRIVGNGDRKGVSKLIGISDVPVAVLSGKIEKIIENTL